LENRLLLAAPGESAIVAEHFLASSSSPIAEGEQESASSLYELFVALGTAEHRDSFGEYLYSYKEPSDSYTFPYNFGGNNTYYGPYGGILIIGGGLSVPSAIKIDPPTTNLQFASDSDQQTQLGGRDLAVNDDRYAYHLRGGELVISSVDAEGKPVVLSSTLVSGKHVSLFLVEDRVAVVSNHTDQGAITVLDVSDGEHPKMVQEIRIDGEVSHAQLHGSQLAFAFLSSRELVPDLRVVADDVGVRYETEQEFAQSVRDHFAEIVDEHMPHYLSTDGTGSLIRGGPILDATRLTVLSGVNEEVTGVATINLLDDEPGIGSAVGITAKAGNVFAATDGMFIVGRGDQENEIFRFRLQEPDGNIRLDGRGPWTSAYSASESDYFDGKLFLRDFVVSDGRNSRVGVTVVEQQGAELIATETVIDLGSEATSTQFHGGELFIVSHRNFKEGIPADSAVSDPNRYEIPTETVIRTVDLTDPAEPKRRTADLILDGFYTYLNFISDDRLLAAGSTNGLSEGLEASGSEDFMPLFRTFSGSVALYDLSSGQATLLDSIRTVGSTGGAVGNEENPFRWFDDEAVLAFPVSMDTGTFGWSKRRGWSGGDAVSWVRIDSEEKPLDRISPLATHNHSGEDVVRHSAVVEGALLTISDDELFTTPLEEANPVASSQQFGSYFDEADEAISPIKIDGSLAAREFLITTYGVEPSDLTLAGIEIRQDDAEFLFVSGLGRFVVHYSDQAGHSLLNQASASLENMYHNADLPFDTNGDGRVTAADALVIVNALSRRPERSDGLMPSRRANAPTTGLQMDTNNDYVLTAGDALSVVNYLARMQSTEASGEFIEHGRLDHVETVDELVRDGDWIGTLLF
tara:strand:- start:63754 stop:66336 length:2583 start_codon:yes stop_codon:yes gene_type:complete